MNKLTSRKLGSHLPMRSNYPFSFNKNSFDELINSFDNWFETVNFPTDKSLFENIRLIPSIDIVEDETHFKVEAEMPGMGEEDIKISLNNGILSIKGEKTTSKKDEAKNYMMREINYGRYERSIDLPNDVDLDKAKASFKKGMLWIDIPKNPESAKTSRILKIERA